jgi:hypothetical protein
MAKMWLNKGINKGILEQEPGFRHPGSGVMFHLRNLFYTFVKNIFLNLPPWNMEQIGQQYSKSLKLQHKIDLKCSRGTGTWWNKMQKGQ